MVSPFDLMLILRNILLTYEDNEVVDGRYKVAVDCSVTPNRLNFSPRFNVAAPFIDRHMAEGHADKLAIRTVAEVWIYGELASHVSRVGNLLRDCPGSSPFLWRHQGGICAGHTDGAGLIKPATYLVLNDAKDADGESALVAHCDPSSRITNISAGFISSTICRRRQPAGSSGSGFATGRGRMHSNRP